MSVRRGGIVLPSLAAGVLLALSLPPFGAWPSAFIGAALLFWRLAGLGLRNRVLAGWVAGIGCFAIGLFWAQDFNWYGAVVLVLVESLTDGDRRRVDPAAAGPGARLRRRGHPDGGRPDVVALRRPAGRGRLLGPDQRAAAHLGPAGRAAPLTAVVWTGGVALGELGGHVVRWRRDRRKAPLPRVGLAALVVVIAVGSVGEFAPDGGPAIRTISVASVQGGGRRGFNQFEVGQAGVFSAQLDASSALEGSARHLALVVWPEDVVAPGRPLVGSPEAAQLAALARNLHADGAGRRDRDRAAEHVPQ